MLFLLLFLFVPMTALADNDLCQNMPQNTCISTGGCYWTNNTCTQCEEGHFCPGQNSLTSCPNWYANGGICSCPSEFPRSTQGTLEETDCYIQCSRTSDNADYTTENCGVTKLNVQNNDCNITCKNSQNQLTSYTFAEDYHVEMDANNEYGCYLNERPCNLFRAQYSIGNEITEINPNDSNQASGTAIWTEENGYQIKDPNATVNDTSCKYQLTNRDYADKACKATIIFQPNEWTISSANNTVSFVVSGYYCTSCIDDVTISLYHYPSTNTNNSQGCINPIDPEEQYYQVCLCNKIPQGYYRTVIWNYQLNPSAGNYIAACPHGQTTNNPGAGVNIDSCHYSADTQFCDARGCFKLDDINSWDFNN